MRRFVSASVVGEIMERLGLCQTGEGSRRQGQACGGSALRFEIECACGGYPLRSEIEDPRSGSRRLGWASQPGVPRRECRHGIIESPGWEQDFARGSGLDCDDAFDQGFESGLFISHRDDDRQALHCSTRR